MDTDGEKIAAGERGRRAERRAENKVLWQEFYERRQYRAHSRMAADYARRAMALQDGGTLTRGEEVNAR
jgi:hypothetical protein